MRFLQHALGEIILVVIGILIALQINNRNEERVEQEQLREYARRANRWMNSRTPSSCSSGL